MHKINSGNDEQSNCDLDDSAISHDSIELVENTKTLKEKLEDSIKICLATPEFKANVNYLTKEINLYEINGQLFPNLKKIKEGLLTIRPTSTQNERNFSTAVNLVTKKRTRLSDRAIDALCFLKYYFSNKNKN